MLGLLLIYWIGKKYYELATEHNRSPWGYAILGVFVYYFSQLFFGLILAIAMPSLFEGLDTGSELLLNLVGVLVGLGIWYLLFLYLKNKWEGEQDSYEDTDDLEIESIGKTE
ncbi:MAG: hypothetical protein U0V04_03195 [Spirosomataceae bacterium]|jgi:hypothetical protein|nr:hypothetical protein [Bacteroidota bacterium]